MEMQDFISTDECCAHYNIEKTFIGLLHNYGLLEITTIDGKEFIHTSHLHELEKQIRMHYILDINPEGIEAIFHLLKRMEKLQQEMTYLRNRLQLHEHF